MTATPLPSGHITFLFTDIAGSTRLWESFPEHMAAALEHHDAVLRSTIEGHGGYIFTTAGDQFCAAFQLPDDALAAAVEAQQLVDGGGLPEGNAIRVRMGIHSGAAQLREGDYFGPNLSRVARLHALGHGGQILASGATVELVEHSLPAGMELRDLGWHNLRDLDDPEHVFQLTAPSLAGEFPPLVTPGARQSNLPARATRLVGRESDLEQLDAAVMQHPMLTLVGPGGVGKTRLALAVAHALLPRFRDGAWFCDLRGVDEGGVVEEQVVAMLQLPVDVESPADALMRYLADRELLLVFDNCEHVIEATARAVGRIRAECPGVTVIATSREQLRLEGEQVWPVRPLTLPGEEHEDGSSTSVRLFVERAQAVAPDFERTDQNAQAIAGICRRLDGLPLAIELAAALVPAHGIAALAAMIDDQTAVLASERRGGGGQHDTLEATIDWSYQLLDAPLRELSETLAVFAGGFDEAAAAAVCAPLLAEDVGDRLRDLVRKSLLQADVSAVPVRYRVLEPIRQFAWARLDAAGSLDATRRRHAEHFVERLEARQHDLSGPEEAAAVSEITTELDNLRAAFRWAQTSGEAGYALRICMAMVDYSFWREHYELGRWCADAADLEEAQEHPLLADVLGLAACFAAVAGRIDLALEYIGRSVARQQATGAPPSFFPEIVLSAASEAMGNPAQALVHIENAGEIARSAGNQSHLALARAMRAIRLDQTGRSEQAQEAAAEAFTMSRASNNPTANAFALWALGVTSAADDADGAAGLLEQAGVIAATVQNQYLLGIAMSGSVSFGDGGGDDLDQQLRTLAYLLEHWQRSGDAGQQWGTLRETARYLASAGQFDAAQVILAAEEAGNRHDAPSLPGSLTRRSTIVEEVETALGRGKMRALWARGSLMTLEDAGEYAQSVVAELLSASQ